MAFKLSQFLESIGVSYQKLMEKNHLPLISYPVMDCHFDSQSQVFAHYSIQGNLPVRTYFQSNPLFQLSRQSIEDELKWLKVDFTSAAIQWDEARGALFDRQLFILKREYRAAQKRAVEACRRSIPNCPLQQTTDDEGAFDEQFYRFAEELRLSTFRTHGIRSDLAFTYNFVQATPESTVVLVGGAEELFQRGDFRRIPFGGYHSRDRDVGGNFYGINLNDERVLVVGPREELKRLFDLSDPGLKESWHEGFNLISWDEVPPEIQNEWFDLRRRSSTSIDRVPPSF
ncbi:MAG: hypothetical protein ACO3A2_01175 [Bdellovibrionia bacterium]